MVAIYEKGTIWIDAREAAERFNCSAAHIRRRIDEMSIEMKKRYPNSVIRDGKLVRVNYLALCDWMLRRHDYRHGLAIPPYNPQAIRRETAMELKVQNF